MFKKEQRTKQNVVVKPSSIYFILVVCYLFLLGFQSLYSLNNDLLLYLMM